MNELLAQAEAFAKKVWDAIAAVANQLMNYKSEADARFAAIEKEIADLKGEPGGGGDPGPIDPPIDPPTNPDEIFIFHFDGNNNDDDDIAALPIAALYASGAGLAPVMSFFYNNNRDEKDVDWQVEAMRNSAAFAEKLGITTYDYAADEAGTLAKLVELLSSGSKVTSFEGGPMGTIYRALEMTPVECHKNITLISHSQWNENRDNSGENKKWNPMKEKFTDVSYIDIGDQNTGFKSDDWNYLDLATDPILQEARSLMYAAQAKVNDASDSGMLFWYLTGKELGRVSDARAWLEANPPTYAGSNPPFGSSTFTEPEPGLLMAQAENFTIAGTGFEVQTDVTGFSGSGYITYTGPDSFEKVPLVPQIIEHFVPSKSGVYQLQIHNRGGDPADPSKKNDTWVVVYGESFYADDNGTKVFAKGNLYEESNVTTANDSDDGFLKFYSNASGDWTMQTSAIDNKPRPIMVELQAGNQYGFELAGRSNGHSIDAVFLRHSDIDPSAIDKYLGVSNPGPIDPPTNPDIGEVEIVPQSEVITGQTVVMEAVVSSSLNVAQVDFYLNGSDTKYKTEKSYKYEAPTQVPNAPFSVTVIVQFTTGDMLTKTVTFEPSTGSDPGTGGGGGGGTPIDPQPAGTSFQIPPDGFFEAAKEGSVVSWGVSADQFDEGPIFEADWKRVLPMFGDIKSHANDDLEKAYGDACKDPVTGRHTATWKVDDYIVVADPAAPGVDPWQDKMQWKYMPNYFHMVKGDLSFIEREFMLPAVDGRFGPWEPGHGKLFNGTKLETGTPTPPGKNTTYGDDWFEYSSSFYDGGVQENWKGDFYGSRWPDNHKDSNTYYGMAVYGKDPRMVQGFHSYQHEFWYCDCPTNQRHALRTGVWITVQEVCQVGQGRDGILAARLKYEDENEWRYMRYITDLDMRGQGSSKLTAGGMIFYYGGGPQNMKNRSIRFRRLETRLK